MFENEGGRGSAAQVELHGVLPPGTVLRGYELKSVLGQGAFGITYRALDTTLHRDVAIKEYLPTTLALREGRTTVLPRSPDHVEQFAWGRERFLDEARVLARLDRTSSIVRVFDFLEANGTAYMVMALIEGETLHKRLAREKRLTPEAVERIVFPLLDGLEEVHAATFLHRDIKPANIMLDGRGQPTLIDFGASRAAMAERSMTMTAIFTPGYAAAEQFIASAKLGPGTDIYGLSATLYHCITGRIPPSAVERILNDDYEPLSKLRPEGYSPALLAGIDAGLAVRADDRPQSIAEWRDMLRHDPASGHDATRVVPKLGRLARAAKRNGEAGVTIRRPVLWGAAAAAILLLAGGGWLGWVAVSPANVTTAALSLSAEQLEQALAERRKADMLAAEKRRLEDEARRRMESDNAAKQQADQELTQARAARQKAEDELAQLKADIEARRKAETGQRDQAEAATRRAAEEAAQRKAEAETAAMRQAEDGAQKKAAAEAESKRLADEAFARAEAERQRADNEARLMADAEAAKRKSDDDMRQKAEAAAKEKGDAESQKKAAEAAETGSRLEPTDRQRIQVALTSLGFDTRGSDGVFGPRSREMIEAWQKARKLPPTGFLSAAQQQTLLKEAAPAVGKFDDEQKKAEEAKQRSVAAAPAPSSTPTPADGLWRGTYACEGGIPFTQNLEVRLTNGFGSWSPITQSGANDQTLAIRISVDASSVTVIRQKVVPNVTALISGRYESNSIRASGLEPGTGKTCTLALTREAATASTAGPTAAPSSAYDGIYVGTSPHHLPPLRFVRLEVTNGRGSGTITSTGACTTSFSITISAAGNASGEAIWCATDDRRVVEGGFEGQRLVLRNLGLNMVRTVMTRETAAAPSAGAFDGTYAGTRNVGGYSGSASRVDATLQVANGRGSGTVSSPGCSPSPFSVTVSPAGDVSGEFVLMCVVGGAIPVTGPTRISGRFDGRSINLNFQSERAGGFQVPLTRSGN